MKPNHQKTQVTLIGNATAQTFGISNDPAIFEILRDKMYSDKIGAVCREVASNSRDANRESGKADVPIEITILEPDNLLSFGSLSIAFVDQGPGISPNRMSNVFLMYGASTKRSTNTQTGGFGLGAKTPFAYAETFTVVTVSDVIYNMVTETVVSHKELLSNGKVEETYSEAALDEDGEPVMVVKTRLCKLTQDEKIRRQKDVYTASLDSTGKGKMINFSTDETKENTGTKIIVPIQAENEDDNTDRLKFEEKVIRSTMFWDVQPKITGFTSYKYEKVEVLLTSEKAMEITSQKPSFRIIKHEGTLFDEAYGAFIDGILYPLNAHQLNFYSSGLGYGVMVAFDFGNGELALQASRESVQYDDKDNKAQLTERYEAVMSEMKQRVQVYIEEQPTYLQACQAMMALRENRHEENLTTEQKMWNAAYKWLDNSSAADLEYNGQRLYAKMPSLQYFEFKTVNSQNSWNKPHDVLQATIQHAPINDRLINRTYLKNDKRSYASQNATLLDLYNWNDSNEDSLDWMYVKELEYEVNTLHSKKEQKEAEKKYDWEVEFIYTTLGLTFQSYKDVPKKELPKTEGTTYARYIPGEEITIKVRASRTYDDMTDWNSDTVDYIRAAKKFAEPIIYLPVNKLSDLGSPHVQNYKNMPQYCFDYNRQLAIDLSVMLGFKTVAIPVKRKQMCIDAPNAYTPEQAWDVLLKKLDTHVLAWEKAVLYKQSKVEAITIDEKYLKVKLDAGLTKRLKELQKVPKLKEPKFANDASALQQMLTKYFDFAFDLKDADTKRYDAYRAWKKEIDTRYPLLTYWSHYRSDHKEFQTYINAMDKCNGGGKLTKKALSSKSKVQKNKV